MRSSGVLNAMEMRLESLDENVILDKNTKRFARQTNFKVDAVDLKGIKSIFYLLGIVYASTIGILALERYIFKKIRTLPYVRNSSRFFVTRDLSQVTGKSRKKWKQKEVKNQENARITFVEIHPIN